MAKWTNDDGQEYGPDYWDGQFSYSPTDRARRTLEFIPRDVGEEISMRAAETLRLEGKLAANVTDKDVAMTVRCGSWQLADRLRRAKEAIACLVYDWPKTGDYL